MAYNTQRYSQQQLLCNIKQPSHSLSRKAQQQRYISNCAQQVPACRAKAASQSQDTVARLWDCGLDQKQWMQHLVEDIVQNIEQAPFLAARFHSDIDRIGRFKVDDAVLSTPELWSSVVQYISSEMPDTIVVAHTVDELTYNGNKECQGGDQCNFRDNIYSMPEQGSLISGHVGDCCDEPELHQEYNLYVSKLRSVMRDSQSKGAEASAKYWGLAVQSKSRPGLDGCYLLKTVANVQDTHCTCTYYSLTRVCEGQSIKKQEMVSWTQQLGQYYF